MPRALFDESVDDVPTDGSRKIAIIVCLFASMGGIYFGYDQGVTSGVLVMNSFLKEFCDTMDGPYNADARYNQCRCSSMEDLPSDWITFTMAYNTVYNVGCVFGALLGGMIADKFGRRGTIFIAGLLFCVGTSWVSLNGKGNVATLLIARWIQGMGTGNSSFSLPLFGAEVSPKELRGFLSGFMQMMIVTGLLIANIVNESIQSWDDGWRYANAVAMVPAAIVMLGIFSVPESPRWVYLHKGMDEAEVVLKRLRQTDHVTRELTAIGDQIARDGGREAEWRDLLHPSIFTRVVTAMLVQMLQQMTGINPVFTYGGLIFKDVLNDEKHIAVLSLSVVNFVSTIPAMRWVDTTGRRQLLLIGAVGMAIGHLMTALTFMAFCKVTSADDSDAAECHSMTHCSSSVAAYFIVITTAFFVFNFAISWGPIGWIYPAEIFPLGLRAKAVSMSTVANWTMGAIMTLVMKAMNALGIDGIFFLFAIMCVGCGTLVYYYCPETKGILLEDIDELFHRSTIESKYFSEDTPSPHLA